jgi:hypothetical protein
MVGLSPAIVWPVDKTTKTIRAPLSGHLDLISILLRVQNPYVASVLPWAGVFSNGNTNQNVDPRSGALST